MIVERMGCDRLQAWRRRLKGRHRFVSLWWTTTPLSLGVWPRCLNGKVRVDIEVVAAVRDVARGGRYVSSELGLATVEAEAAPRAEEGVRSL
jgi:hypothetical protein